MSAELPLGRALAVRDARRAAALSQEEVALRSGLQRKTVYLLENGKHDPRLSTIARTAVVLDVSVDELVGRAGLIQAATRRYAPTGAATDAAAA